DKRVFGTLIGGLVLIWVLRLAGVYKNWPFVILSIVWSLIWLLGVAAQDRFALMRKAAEGRPQHGALEWVGITEPWDPAGVDELDRQLAWTEEEHSHARA